eukprot:TRINITY_DN1306_c0_g1_i1.p1 TRINITY_DN1306_c0_g1~~TRINITY_DN1306_c0_g1_i1.p1  ORF type:complete len:236 (-),score=25.56 TRINITY_DN1306_c0_g1_i1:76-747(-)
MFSLFLFASFILHFVNGEIRPFEEREEFRMECKNSTGQWSHGLICQETGLELQFLFGVDSFFSCGWLLSQEEYTFAERVMKQEDAWQCRVPLSSDHTFFLPFSIPLWGLVEPSHIHLNYHMNFVFHVDDGRIIGVGVYPVRDRFQFGRVGSLINLHGPIRWFNKHSYMSLSASLHDQNSPSSCSFGTVAGWCLLMILMSTVGFILLYTFKLRPQLIKRFVKHD